jgi:hypothetical protein
MPINQYQVTTGGSFSRDIRGWTVFAESLDSARTEAINQQKVNGMGTWCHISHRVKMVDVRGPLPPVCRMCGDHHGGQCE